MIRILLCLLVSFLLVEEIRSECCQFKSFSGSCCGFGRCNIFCCNCDPVTISGRRLVCRPADTCKFSLQEAINAVKDRIKDGKDIYDTIKGKRDITNINTNNKFNSIDTDSDDKISLQETLAYLKKSNSSLGANDLETIKSSFDSLDKNKDGFLQPEEFDKSLKR